MASYKNCSTAHDDLFTDLVNGRGHHPDLVFEVIRQVNNGPKVNTKLWTLQNGSLEEVFYNEQQPLQKKHVNKNYKCVQHGLFFAVYIYVSRSTVYNGHHMRLYCYDRENPQLFDEFRTAINC